MREAGSAGARMFDLFRRGRYAELIAQATTVEGDGCDPDWTAIIELCDAANLSAENGKDVVCEVSKRMRDMEKQQCMSDCGACLKLTEALFKNGGMSMHRHIAGDALLLTTIATLARASPHPQTARLAQALALSLRHFASVHRRNGALRPLAAVLSDEEAKLFSAAFSPQECAEQDWTGITGTGSCGIKNDERSYQEVSPRAATVEEVTPEGSRGEVYGCRAAHRHTPHKPQVEPEIAAIWDLCEQLRTSAKWATRAGGGFSGDAEAKKLAAAIEAKRAEANRAINSSPSDRMLEQLLLVLDEINVVLGNYASLSTVAFAPAVSAIPGVYERRDPTEPAHHVRLTHRKDRFGWGPKKAVFEWRDRAGAAWELTAVSREHPDVLTVGKGCPHLANGHTEVAVRWRDESESGEGGVASVVGPGGEHYRRVGGWGDWEEPEAETKPTEAAAPPTLAKKPAAAAAAVPGVFSSSEASLPIRIVNDEEGLFPRIHDDSSL